MANKLVTGIPVVAFTILIETLKETHLSLTFIDARL
jgi:hypothetical protein